MTKIEKYYRLIEIRWHFGFTRGGGRSCHIHLVTNWLRIQLTEINRIHCDCSATLLVPPFQALWLVDSRSHPSRETTTVPPGFNRDIMFVCSICSAKLNINYYIFLTFDFFKFNKSLKAYFIYNTTKMSNTLYAKWSVILMRQSVMYDLGLFFFMVYMINYFVIALQLCACEFREARNCSFRSSVRSINVPAARAPKS